ncbi:MAG: hypothetical protein HOP21_05750 [Methylotenera sp.]|nr:hypothetical protein [Methylotenera sp.]
MLKSRAVMCGFFVVVAVTRVVEIIRAKSTVNLNTANPLTVTLSGQGNGTVIADAIRIAPDTPSN